MIVKKSIDKIIIRGMIEIAKKYEKRFFDVEIIESEWLDLNNRLILNYVSPVISKETAGKILKYFIDHHKHDDGEFLYYKVSRNRDIALKKELLKEIDSIKSIRITLY